MVIVFLDGTAHAADGERVAMASYDVRDSSALYDHL